MGKTTLWRAGIETAEAAGLCVLQAGPRRARPRSASPVSATFSTRSSRTRSSRFQPDSVRRSRAHWFSRRSRARPRMPMQPASRSSTPCEDSHAPVTSSSPSTTCSGSTRRPPRRSHTRRGDSKPRTSAFCSLGARDSRVRCWKNSGTQRSPTISRTGGRPARSPVVAPGRPGPPRRRSPPTPAGRGAPGLGRKPLLRARDRANARRAGVSVEAGRPLPVPDSLHDLVHGRLLALPPESRDFLIAAAAHAHPTISITETASGVGRTVGLPPACEARIVETDGDRIRFTHPLLAAGALEMADPKRRAEIHARLAELLEDPEARAWQLAASVDEPEESVAAVLEQAAQHAQRRGAPRPAALLLDRARELTPSAREDDATRRAVDAAYLHFESGDARRAEAQLRELIAPMEPGLERARALWVLARIRTYQAPHEATELFLQVVDEAKDNRELLLPPTRGLHRAATSRSSGSAKAPGTPTRRSCSLASSTTRHWRATS